MSRRWWPFTRTEPAAAPAGPARPGGARLGLGGGSVFDALSSARADGTPGVAELEHVARQTQGAYGRAGVATLDVPEWDRVLRRALYDANALDGVHVERVAAGWQREGLAPAVAARWLPAMLATDWPAVSGTARPVTAGWTAGVLAPAFTGHLVRHGLTVAHVPDAMAALAGAPAAAIEARAIRALAGDVNRPGRLTATGDAESARLLAALPAPVRDDGESLLATLPTPEAARATGPAIRPTGPIREI